MWLRKTQTQNELDMHAYASCSSAKYNLVLLKFKRAYLYYVRHGPSERQVYEKQRKRKREKKESEKASERVKVRKSKKEKKERENEVRLDSHRLFTG